MVEVIDRVGRFVSRALDRLDAVGVAVDVDADEVIWNRSRWTGLRPQGRVAAGGSCRLLATMDGWCAVNLPRDDDLDLLPAWLGVEVGDDRTRVVPWDDIAAAVATRSTDEVVGDAQMLGLAVAALPDVGAAPDEQLVSRGTEAESRPWIVRRAGERSDPRSLEGLRVVDLSSLWAGPSCARFLSRSGAEVTKVESTSRPDGARLGNAEFYEWLHAGHEERSVPFDRDHLDGLRSLLDGADVVIEGSRPRALDRLGIVPADHVAARPGRVWLSITAYGRCGPWADRVGFGDDAAVAGGLVDRDDHGPVFVGDAIADPITGCVAAALVVDAVRSGGGRTIDVALRETARAAAHDAVVVW